MIIYLLYHITIMINIIIIYYHHISIISSHNNVSIITIYHIYSHLPMKTIHHRGIPTTHAESQNASQNASPCDSAHRSLSRVVRLGQPIRLEFTGEIMGLTMGKLDDVYMTFI